MGHKVHPIGFRLGINKFWQSKWYADRAYTGQLHEDFRIRGLITKRFADAGIPKVEIDRQANQIAVTIHTAKPGIVIGRSGSKVDELRDTLERLTGKRVRVNIAEIRQPELDAHLVARSIADQIERRVSYKRASKQAVTRSMQRGAQGIRIIMSGRLGGAEMSRRDRESAGKVPLQTLRADIDFGIAEAHTTFGRIGVKVWLYRGDILPNRQRVEAPPPPGRRGGRRQDRDEVPAGETVTPRAAASPETEARPVAADPVAAPPQAQASETAPVQPAQSAPPEAVTPSPELAAVEENPTAVEQPSVAEQDQPASESAGTGPQPETKE